MGIFGKDKLSNSPTEAILLEFEKLTVGIMAASLYANPTYGEMEEAVADAINILHKVDDLYDKEANEE